jgi:nucleoside phosphorylase
MSHARNYAVVSTALTVEYKAVCAHLDDVREVRHEAGTRYEVGRFIGHHGEWQVALVQTGQGNPRAALEVERAISFFKPSHVFFVGVAGGLKDVEICDVVAATKVYGYESGKADVEYKPRVDFGESSYTMTQEATFVARRTEWLTRARLHDPLSMFGRKPQVFVAPIVAGEKLVASTESSTYQFLKSNFSDALAVEMESYGFFRAIHANHLVQALVVRGISDLIDKKGEADASGSQERASAHAAAFMFEVLSRAGAPVATSPPYSGRVLDVREDQEWWKSYERLAAQLYPQGPAQNEVWSRAGGDLATLNLNSPGRGSWHASLKILQLGGGGSSITPSTLLETMLEDYSSNEDLKRFAASVGITPITSQPVRRDKEDKQLLSESNSHSLTSGQEAPREKVNKVKILFLSANPVSTNVLQLDEEMRAITQKIRAAEHRDLIEIVIAGAVRPDDLLQALNEHRPHIVQFSGHGSTNDEIIVCDEKGAPKAVSKKALVALFNSVKANVQVVMLNSCYSRSQAEAIVSVVPCAIGMKKSISDRAAIVFAASFYRAIGFGRSAKEAFDQGGAALMLEDISEEDTPELLTQDGVDASKIVLISPTSPTFN